MTINLFDRMNCVCVCARASALVILFGTRVSLVYMFECTTIMYYRKSQFEST